MPSTTIHRRHFLKTTAWLAAAAGAGALDAPTAQAAAAEDSLFRWERIRPDAWVVFNGGGNVLVLADRGGAIVVDCKINGMGQLLRTEIGSRVGGNIQGWLEALPNVRRACDGDTVVIAGHGPSSTRAVLDEQATYFARLRDLVARERRAGRSREEIVKLPNTVFPDYGFAGEWTENLGLAFDELDGRKPREGGR